MVKDNIELPNTVPPFGKGRFGGICLLVLIEQSLQLARLFGFRQSEHQENARLVRYQAVSLDKRIVPVDRDPSVAAATGNDNGDSGCSDFLYPLKLVSRRTAVVGVAADDEPMRSGRNIRLRGGGVSADVSRDY